MARLGSSLPSSEAHSLLSASPCALPVDLRLPSTPHPFPQLRFPGGCLWPKFPAALLSRGRRRDTRSPSIFSCPPKGRGTRAAPARGHGQCPGRLWRSAAKSRAENRRHTSPRAPGPCSLRGTLLSLKVLGDILPLSLLASGVSWQPLAFFWRTVSSPHPHIRGALCSSSVAAIRTVTHLGPPTSRLCDLTALYKAEA